MPAYLIANIDVTDPRGFPQRFNKGMFFIYELLNGIVNCQIRF